MLDQLNILEWFSEIPLAIWVGMIAFVSSISGVVLSNKHHAKVLKLQLKHASVEADRARKFEARRALYVEAAGELARAYATLLTLPNVPIEDIGSRLGPLGEAAAKAQLLASDDTAREINDFMLLLNQTVLNLATHVMPITMIKADRDIYENLLKKAVEDVDRELEALRDFNREGNADRELFERLKTAFESSTQIRDEYQQHRDDAWNKLNQQTLDFWDVLLPEVDKVGRASVPVMVALRSELDLQTDIDRYRKEYEIRGAKAMSTLYSFREKIKELMQPKEESDSNGDSATGNPQGGNGDAPAN